MNELLNHVPKDILMIIEDYYHPYKLMYDEVVKEIEQNTKYKDNHQYAWDRIIKLCTNQIYINENRLYYLKKMSIEELNRNKEYVMKKIKEDEKRNNEYLQDIDNNIELVTNLIKRESEGEEVINNKFWNEFNEFDDMRLHNSRFLKLKKYDSDDD